MRAFDALCSFVTPTSLLGMYFLAVALVLSRGVKQVTTLPEHIAPKKSLYDPIYMGSLYIPFHFFIKNIGCEIDKSILDPLYLQKLVAARVDFSYGHIMCFNGFLHPICLQDTTTLSSIAMSSLPSSVAAETIATSASDSLVRFQKLQYAVD